MLAIVTGKQRRRLRAQKDANGSVWFGLGLFGIVGWSIAIPTLVGVGIGAWIDHRWESNYSWTLMFMVGGVIVGCFTAWQWIYEESSKGEWTDEEERTE